MFHTSHKPDMIPDYVRTFEPLKIAELIGFKHSIVVFIASLTQNKAVKAPQILFVESAFAISVTLKQRFSVHSRPPICSAITPGHAALPGKLAAMASAISFLFISS